MLVKNTFNSAANDAHLIVTMTKKGISLPRTPGETLLLFTKRDVSDSSMEYQFYK